MTAGGAAIYGTCVANSAQIAVDEINALGGDIQFELMTEDDVNDAETSVNAYNALMDDGMQILVGTVTTQPALSVVPLAYEDRVFTLTPSASGDDVISINDNDNVFQICFTDSNQGSRSAQYIDENFDSPKIAIIYKNDDQYSIGIRDNFKAEADSRGMDIVYEGTFTEASQTDFNVQLAGAQSAGADLLFLPIYYTPASVILTQANAMGYAPTFFGVDGMDGILTAENFDASLAEGVYLLTPFSADSEDEMTQNFVAEYQDRFGEIPNQFGADAYDAIYTLYQAIQAAGATADMSNEEICDALIEVMPTLAVTGQIQQVDGVRQLSFEIQTRFIVLVHAVQALHRNDEVVIDLLDFCIMLLQVCQQTELAVQRSGVGLQVELDFFTGLCVFSYKYFAVVDIHTLDHFAVCKQQELRVSSVVPVQRGERPPGGPSNEIHPQPRNGTRTHREQDIRHLQNHRQADPQGAADESASRNRVHRGQRRTDSLKDSPSERMFFSYGMKRIRSPRPEIKIGASQIGRSYFYKKHPATKCGCRMLP